MIPARATPRQPLGFPSGGVVQPHHFLWPGDDFTTERHQWISIKWTIEAMLITMKSEGLPVYRLYLVFFFPQTNSGNHGPKNCHCQISCSKHSLGSMRVFKGSPRQPVMVHPAERSIHATGSHPSATPSRGTVHWESWRCFLEIKSFNHPAIPSICNQVPPRSLQGLLQLL